MGKRSTKCFLRKKPDSVKRIRETFLDESNDSGHGSDASLIVPDSISLSCEESDLDLSSDSVDSAVVLSSSSVSSKRSIARLAISSKEKMQIKSRLCVGSSSNEPLVKRCKIKDDNGKLTDTRNSNLFRDSVLQNLVSSAGHHASEETPDCGRSAGHRLTMKEVHKTDNTKWSSRENVVPSSALGNHVASVLSSSLQLNTKKWKKPSLHMCFPPYSKDGKVELSIVVQPEAQHRARYMTEGSRGSIKDTEGSGFPKVKLCGFNQPVVLHVFIGSDVGKVQPHLFYQACKVTGKNCTPCMEHVIEGTSVIEINMTPENNMTVSCDCIGILKERNVDVEQRLPYFGLTRCKKRSTRCRIIFRVTVPYPNGTVETLQIASSQILCTQSPGLPEISRKSLTECSVKGGMDLFIIGKNFQKDAKVLFQEIDAAFHGDNELWKRLVDPEKEFMHQSHLICTVPPYVDLGSEMPVKVYVSVLSGGKTSEPHVFTYTPAVASVGEKCETRTSSFRSLSPSFERLSPSSDARQFSVADMVLNVPATSAAALFVASPSSMPFAAPVSCATSDVDGFKTGSGESVSAASVPLMAKDVQLPAASFMATEDNRGSLLDDVSSSHLIIKDVNLASGQQQPSDVTPLGDGSSVAAHIHLEVHPDVDLMLKIDQLSTEITPSERQTNPSERLISFLSDDFVSSVTSNANTADENRGHVDAVTSFTDAQENGSPGNASCFDMDGVKGGTSFASTSTSTDTLVDELARLPSSDAADKFLLPGHGNDVMLEKASSSAAAGAASNGDVVKSATTSEQSSYPATGKTDVNSMTLEFSQLSDADLLSLINPSTFDAV